MMSLLVANIADNGGKLRGADAERGIAFLPDKQSARLAHPPRGIALDGVDRPCEVLRGRQLQQAVQMVVCATNRVDESPFLLANPRNVRPQLRLERVVDTLRPILRAEDDVDDVPGVAVRHCVALRALRHRYVTVPSAGALG